jgi:hypothetical protein
VFTSLSGTCQVSATASSVPGTHALVNAGGLACWLFEVVGGSLSYDLTGSISACVSPAGSPAIRLCQSDSRRACYTSLESFAESGSVSASGVLSPGVYLLECVANGGSSGFPSCHSTMTFTVGP